MKEERQELWTLEAAPLAGHSQKASVALPSVWVHQSSVSDEMLLLSTDFKSCPLTYHHRDLFINAHPPSDKNSR